MQPSFADQSVAEYGVPTGTDGSSGPQINHPGIDGYGRPDWSLVELPHYEPGWHHDQNGWWYADTEAAYLKDCWKDINGHRYYFNQDGYALTDWHEIDRKWFYFEPRAGHPLECAL